MHLFLLSTVLEVVCFCKPLQAKPSFILSLLVAVKMDDKFERSEGDLGSLLITMCCLNNANISSVKSTCNNMYSEKG